VNQFQEQNFKDPAVKYRIIPFWFWNGPMLESEIAFQIAQMATKGVGGFFICARQGLEIPYLSDSWFERVAFAVEKAAEYGLEAWLYDEYPYPSGMSGGEVILQHPDARQHNLVCLSFEVSGPQEFSQEIPWARVLAAQAIPLDQPEPQTIVRLEGNIGNLQVQNVFQKTGLTAYNRKRYFTAQPTKFLTWSAPEGKWRVEIFVEKEIEPFKFFGTFFDPCHAGAVKTFLKTTHERYVPLLKRLPGQVKGIFSDEVGLYGNPPWSPALPAFFEERTGYSLLDNLGALQHPAGENTARVRYDYFQSLHLLLRNSYHREVKEWTQAHDLQYVAEVPALRMTTQFYSDTPGGDSAHEKLGRSLEWIIDRYALNLRSNPKMVSSLARQLGRERAMIECFHSVGWSMTLQDARWMIDRLAAMGINFFNFHAFFYTLDGLRKHDAPPSQFLQNPYWPHFKKLADYAGRLSYILSQGQPAGELAVLDPTTSLWTHLGNPFQEFGYSGSDPEEEKRLERLKADWAALCKTLLLYQFDYDHLDPEMLALGRVTDRGKLEIGHAAYSTIILPPLTNLEAAAWARLKEFLAKGGTVIALGLLPYEQIEAGSRVASEMWGQFGLASQVGPDDYWQEAGENGEMPFEKGQGAAYFLKCPGGIQSDQLTRLVTFLKGHLDRVIELEVEEADRKALLAHRRVQGDNSRLLFLSNQEGNQITVGVGSLNEGGQDTARTEELDLETGEIIPLSPVFSGQDQKLEVRLAPYQARLFRFSRVAAKPGEVETGPDLNAPGHVELKINAAQEWQVNALQPNAARLGLFNFALDLDNKGLNEGWQAGLPGVMWPPVEPKTLIDQLDDLARSEKLALPLNFSQTFGTPMKYTLAYPLTCWYETAFEVAEMPPDCQLRMDAGAIEGAYTIFLNGQALDPANFKARREYDISNRACEIGSLLVKGTNRLVVRVEARCDWDGLLDPLYLTGNFGVYPGSNGILQLASLPAAIGLRANPPKGFPFYAGTLAYSTIFKLAELPRQETFELVLEGLDANLHECLEVTVNDSSLGVRPWSPYTWQGRCETLKVGENTLEVRVTNTLVGLLEGKFFDYDRHQLLNIEDL